MGACGHSRARTFLSVVMEYNSPVLGGTMMRRNLIITAIALTAIFTLIGGASFGLITMVQYGIGVEAEREAEQWAQFLAEDTPNLQALLQSDTPRDQLVAYGRAISQGSSVFRFDLFDHTGSPVVSVSRDGSYHHAAAGHHADAIARILSGDKFSHFVHDDTDSAHSKKYYVEAYTPILSKGEVIGVAIVFIDKTGMYSWFVGSAINFSIAASAIFSLILVAAYFAVAFLREKQRKSRKSIDYLTNFDTVSGLLNRDAFFKDARVRTDKKCTAMLYVDVDNFKSTNDVFGHQAGDMFLRHVGNAIGRSIAPGDIAARIGGDEFVAVIGADDPEAILSMVERIQEEVKVPVRNGGVTVVGGISVGIYIADGQTMAISECLHKADLALYQAKADGRGLHRTFTPALETAVERRQKVEGAIRKGLDLQLFSLHFQPLLDQASKRCVGFEALLRLSDEDGEAISPVEFIPIAEAIGEIERIGSWVLQAAMREAANWPAELFVSINLSVRQFDSDELVGTVTRLLDETGLAADRLELEVTESLLMQDSDGNGRQLAELRALGISIAMDDFGTGYSSLGYLWKFGFDKLKIDRSFIVGLEDGDDRASDILDAIIALGHRLNMQVTAEGIETEKQAAILSTLSCDQFQGYYFGRPMRIADIAPFLLNNVAENHAVPHQQAGAKSPRETSFEGQLKAR